MKRCIFILFLVTIVSLLVILSESSNNIILLILAFILLISSSFIEIYLSLKPANFNSTTDLSYNDSN
ncbi:MAG: hypothetical protein FH751_01345 [Firmicutes bacterium]|nr:hypothetical protein [Bacillota bacterium]